MKEFKDLSYGPYGEQNLLDLYLPDQSNFPAPLVVLIHGGGWRSGSKSAHEWSARSLAKEGFASASIQYRFWPEWVFPAAVDDAYQAVYWLQNNAARFGIDPERIGFFGTSAGAHISSFLALNTNHSCKQNEPCIQPINARCVVDCYGPVDFIWMMQTASAELVGGFMGKPLRADTVTDYLSASPTAMIRQNPPPFLILHGTLDTGEKMGDVPIGISLKFAENLKAMGGDVELVVIEGAPHGFMCNSESTFFKQHWPLVLKFLHKHLDS